MRSGPVILAIVAAMALAACGTATGRATKNSGRAHETVTAAAGAAPRSPDQARYMLDLAYDRRRFTLSGTETIAFRNASAAPVASVWLRVWANAFGGCRVNRAHVTMRSGGSLGRRRSDCTALEIRLPRALAPGATTSVGLQIRVTAPTRPDRFGRFRGAGYFGNAIPILAVTDARGLQLPPYTFAGESFYSLTSSWRVRLRVPAGQTVASTGTQTGSAGDGTVTLVAPKARDFMLVVGRFSVVSRRAGPVLVRRFSVPGTSGREVDRTLRVATLAMRRFAAWYGPYDRPEVDLVEAPGEVARGGVAMEYPELVLTPADPTSIAHELAHQWFYSIVGDDEWSEPWLDESFAEFTAARLPPREVPNRLRDCRIPSAADTPLDATMARVTRVGGRYVRVVYVGGACTLRAFQRALGPGPFDAFMRRLVATHRDGIETTADFVAAIRAAAPGNATVDRLLRRTGLVG